MSLNDRIIQSLTDHGPMPAGQIAALLDDTCHTSIAKLYREGRLSRTGKSHSYVYSASLGDAEKLRYMAYKARERMRSKRARKEIGGVSREEYSAQCARQRQAKREAKQKAAQDRLAAQAAQKIATALERNRKARERRAESAKERVQHTRSFAAQKPLGSGRPIPPKPVEHRMTSDEWAAKGGRIQVLRNGEVSQPLQRIGYGYGTDRSTEPARQDIGLA